MKSVDIFLNIIFRLSFFYYQYLFINILVIFFMLKHLHFIVFYTMYYNYEGNTVTVKASYYEMYHFQYLSLKAVLVMVIHKFTKSVK
jgi:hypothetical protein